MLRNLLGRNFRDVAERHGAEVCEVGLTGFRIPLATENAMIAHFIERNADAADSCEQVDKSKLWLFYRLKWDIFDFVE